MFSKKSFSIKNELIEMEYTKEKFFSRIAELIYEIQIKPIENKIWID
jgi:hypothetical protein